MPAWLYLSWKHLSHHKWASACVIAALAATFFLPATTRVLIADFERDASARSRNTPLICGVHGNRYDLTLAALYFRQAELEPFTQAQLQELQAQVGDKIVPMRLGNTARGFPFVGAPLEYLEQRNLQVIQGTPPLFLGDCVLGSQVAQELGLSPGSQLFTDARQQYDLAQAPPVELNVVGVLSESGSADDRAVFGSLRTAWVLDGFLHGHQGAEEIDPQRLLGRDQDNIVVGPALVAHYRFDEASRKDFHLHADEERLPLTAALVFPAREKSRILMKTRVNAQAALAQSAINGQGSDSEPARSNRSNRLALVSAPEVVDELFRYVFRIRSLLDGFVLFLGGATFLLALLVLFLSLRLRAGELTSLARMGVSPGSLRGLVGTEVLLVLGSSVLLSAGCLALLRALAPHWTQFLR